MNKSIDTESVSVEEFSQGRFCRLAVLEAVLSLRPSDDQPQDDQIDLLCRETLLDTHEQVVLSQEMRMQDLLPFAKLGGHSSGSEGVKIDFRPGVQETRAQLEQPYLPVDELNASCEGKIPEDGEIAVHLGLVYMAVSRILDRPNVPLMVVYWEPLVSLSHLAGFGLVEGPKQEPSGDLDEDETAPAVQTLPLPVGMRVGGDLERYWEGLHNAFNENHLLLLFNQLVQPLELMLYAVDDKTRPKDVRKKKKRQIGEMLSHQKWKPRLISEMGEKWVQIAKECNYIARFFRHRRVPFKHALGHDLGYEETDIRFSPPLNVGI